MPYEPLSYEPTDGDYYEHWKNIKNIRHLIIQTEGFIVYIDNEVDVDWQTTEAYDKAGHKNQIKHNEILNAVERLETYPCEELPEGTRIHYKRLVAQGLARSFDGDYKNATSILNVASNYIRDRSEETSRFWYLSSSAAMALIILFFGIVIIFLRRWMFFLLGRQGTWLCVSIAAGAGGALLSVITRSGKLNFDCSAGKKLHFLEGASRIWAGGLSGFLVGVAIQSGFFLATLSNGLHQISLMLLGSFVGGAGERLGTSIISKFERIQINDETNYGKLKEKEDSTDE